MNISRAWITSLPLILLSTAIAFSPRFSFGTIASGKALDIRLEDIILLALLVLSASFFLLSKKTTVSKPPLFTLVVGWIGISLFSILINLSLENIDVSAGFFYLLKEIEFFGIYFYTYYHIRNIQEAKVLLWAWIVFAFVNALWIFIQIVGDLKITYYYGPTMFAEPQGPSLSGGFFLIMFFFLGSLYLYYLHRIPGIHKKIILAVATLLPAIGVISSGSRSAFLGFVVALAVAFFLYISKQYKEGRIRLALRTLGISIAISLIGLLLLPSIPGTARFFNADKLSFELHTDNAASRLSIWTGQIQGLLNKPTYLLFGYGKSYILEKQQPHNQYLQTLVDTGIVGSLIFLFIIATILKKCFRAFYHSKDALSVGVSAGMIAVTGALATMAMGAEVLRVAKIAEPYWFFAALTLAMLNFSSKSRIHEQH